MRIICDEFFLIVENFKNDLSFLNFPQPSTMLRLKLPNYNEGVSFYITE